MVVVPSRTGRRGLSADEVQDRRAGGAASTGRSARLAWTPVLYQYRSFPQEQLLPLYAASDVMLVTPLRDGMNLVAKEYVAARADGHGRADPERDGRRRQRAGRGGPGQPQRHTGDGRRPQDRPGDARGGAARGA